jgi:MoaA/NifB/PqqE/SkfB family radical SAM enzyme
MLTARGILVKVNSVMIPGVNDQHLAEVSKVVKSKGAFLHNVMPLIAEPEHGTFYGLMGQPSPTAEELQELQDACSGDMNMMRHCRQCRADAVGLLGEDRGLNSPRQDRGHGDRLPRRDGEARRGACADREGTGDQDRRAPPGPLPARAPARKRRSPVRC